MKEYNFDTREEAINFLDKHNFKYYIPRVCEYMSNIKDELKAYCVELSDSHEVTRCWIVSITDGKLDNRFEHINCEPILIDGDMPDDIGEIVLKDRELLKDNGIVIVSVTLNKENKKIIAGPEILTRGFIYVKDNTVLIRDMSKLVSDLITTNTRFHCVDYVKLKNLIREELSKFLYKETECNPMIISIIQEI